jgi:RNA polymerase sigma-70 factor (ECF subfamily)
MNLQEFQSTILPMKNMLFRFALRFVRQAAEAEDIVQEVFIKLWNNRENLGPDANLEAWCLTATKNLSIDKLRSKHRRLEPIKPGFDLHDNAASPYQQAVENDVFSKVKNALEELPEKQRLVMHLRDIEGLQYQEIADALDISLDQVKVNLYRARLAVRDCLVKLQVRNQV